MKKLNKLMRAIMPPAPSREPTPLSVYVELTRKHAAINNSFDALLDACSYGQIGHETIILLHNAAGVLDEIGTEGAKTLAAGLREKGKLEFQAIAKAKSWGQA